MHIHYPQAVPLHRRREVKLTPILSEEGRSVLLTAFAYSPFDNKHKIGSLGDSRQNAIAHRMALFFRKKSTKTGLKPVLDFMFDDSSPKLFHG